MRTPFSKDVRTFAGGHVRWGTSRHPSGHAGLTDTETMPVAAAVAAAAGATAAVPHRPGASLWHGDLNLDAARRRCSYRFSEKASIQRRRITMIVEFGTSEPGADNAWTCLASRPGRASGVSILGVYAILLGVLLLVTSSLAAVAWLQFVRPGRVDPHYRLRTPQEVALLAGGRPRAVLTTVVSLRTADMLDFSTPGQVASAPGTLPAPDPHQREALTLLTTAARGRAILRMWTRALARGPALNAARAELRQAGLLPRLDTANIFRYINDLGFLAFVVSAITLPFVTDLRTGSDAFLVELVVLVVLVTAFVLTPRIPVPATNAAGRRIVMALRAEHADLEHGYRDGDDLAFAVALFGPQVLDRADPYLVSVLALPAGGGSGGRRGIWADSSGWDGFGNSGGSDSGSDGRAGDGSGGGSGGSGGSGDGSGGT